MTGPEVEPVSPLERARAGDPDAFRELVEAHQHEVYTLALRLSRDPDLAADIAQEAFVRAWRSLPSFRGDAAFGTWLHRIVVNTTWTQRRKAARHHHDDLDEAVLPLPAGAPGHPEVAGERTVVRARLERALERLPIGQRTVVVLKDVHDWSHEEIADALGISVSASKVRLHRAHLRLRRVLGTMEGDDA